MIVRPLSKLLALFLTKIVNLLGLFKSKRIWVMGGAVGREYVNNGAALHQYILKNHPEIKTYWIINKNSSHVSKVKGKSPLLYRNTLKGNFYTLLAEVLICTHVLPKDVSEYDITRHKNSFKVFISHGIEGFKIKSPEHAKIHLNYDLSLAVSEFEKEIKVKKWGLDKDKVCVTGLPRYDVLEEKRKEKREQVKRIFYMPTWCPEYRKSFTKSYQELTKEEIESFKKEEYYQRIHSFISNPKLLSILEEKGIVLDLFFHQSINPFMQKIIDVPDSSHINLVSNDEDIQKKLLDSDILITDYSSIAWDFLYLDRPTIFFQFDREKHKKTTGSYVQIPEELFGAATETGEDTVEEIGKITKGEDRYKNLREKSRNRFIKYHDGKNCERIINCIFKKK